MTNMKDRKEEREEGSVRVLPAWQRVVFATADIERLSNFARLLPVRCQNPIWCMSVREVMSALSVHDIAVVVCSASLADGSFHDLFRVLHLARWNVPVIVIFPTDGLEQESEAVLLGALGCITPRSDQSKIRQIFVRALAQFSGPCQTEQAEDPSLAANWSAQ